MSIPQLLARVAPTAKRCRSGRHYYSKRFNSVPHPTGFQCAACWREIQAKGTATRVRMAEGHRAYLANNFGNAECAVCHRGFVKHYPKARTCGSHCSAILGRQTRASKAKKEEPVVAFLRNTVSRGPVEAYDVFVAGERRGFTSERVRQAKHILDLIEYRDPQTNKWMFASRERPESSSEPSSRGLEGEPFPSR